MSSAVPVVPSFWEGVAYGIRQQDGGCCPYPEEAGIGVAIFQDNAVSPYFAERREGQFGIAEAIIVAAGSQLAKDVAKTLWAKVVWPRLSRRFGAALKPEPDQKR